jgi:hypothetical protein
MKKALSPVVGGRESTQSEMTLHLDEKAPLSFRLVKQRYYFRKESCKKCGHHWFREVRHDCRECRRIAAQSWAVVREATHGAIRFGSIPEFCEQIIGATGTEYRAFLVVGCEIHGFSIQSYGTMWAVYHKQPLSTFGSSVGLEDANRIQNLEVRPRHNRKQFDPDSQDSEGDLFYQEGGNSCN